MLRLKRYIATVLAMILAINIIQVNISAKTVELISAEENATEVTETPSSDQSAYDNSEVVENSQENDTELQYSVDTEVNQITEQEVVTVPEEPVQTYAEEDIQVVAEGISETNAGATFAESFKTVLKDNGFLETLVSDNAGQITLSVESGTGKILELLSQQEQTATSNYQNWMIDFPSTGTITLTTEYRGLGSDEFPFKGNLKGAALTITTPVTLFNAVYASSDLNGVTIEWTGTADKPILAKKLIADDAAHEVNMPLARSVSFSPYIEQLAGGTGQVTLPDLNYSNVGSNESVDYRKSVGIACGQLSENTNLQLKTLTLPSVAINLKGTNVGSLIGCMSDGSTLTLSEDVSLSNVALNGENVGGIVGTMTNASINFIDGKKMIVNATLTATKTAGGIAGVMSSSTGPLGANVNVVLESVKANGEQNSGVLYGTCAATGEFNPLTGVTFGDTREVSGPRYCGGLFGTLTLSESGKCTLSGTQENKLRIESVLKTASNNTVYGGVAGNLTGTRANALIISDCNITSTVNVGNDSNNYPKYVGGIVAVQGNNVTIDARYSTVILKNPKTPIKTYGIGGLCTNVGDGALLISDNIKVIIDSFVDNQGSSGVAAKTGKGAVVYLKNMLDLSEAFLATCAYSGQIIGQQDCSLIYAPNVDLYRFKTTSETTNYSGVELDDIGNYGELYRITNFLTLNETTYETTLPQIHDTDNTFSIDNSIDYACFALAWQSRGCFSTVSGVTNSNWDSLKSKTIKLTDNIDLTGIGIGGLTRDIYDSSAATTDVFSGMFLGEGKKITLDIGSANDANDVSKGDGRIYWHNATGLFAVVSSQATIQNLFLEGSVRISNAKKSPMYSGAISAIINDTRLNESTLSVISSNVQYDTIVSGANQLYLGGIIGYISEGEARIDFTNSKVKTNITISHSANGSNNHIGGVIGGISENASAKFYFGDETSPATIEGKISSRGSINNLYCGALIGTIFPTKNKDRNININKLIVNDYVISGTASERMGGILGGIWADTDVTLDGIEVNSSTLTANGAAALGGLVYRASGKWTVRSVDLTGLTISANNASALGLLVCHGEPCTEPINGTKNVGGLYLEMAEQWEWNPGTEKGYKVPSSITFGTGVFDEFVAYTAYRDTSGSYDITHNGSGIISLKTDNGTVNMTDSERNTYVNRTDIGKNTNMYSRYYYNLDSIMSELNDANDNKIDTAKELLIWSVCRYADSSLRKHFKTSGISELWKMTTIGGTSDSYANFDMGGLSYYPINIMNESINVQYSNIVFYNNKIEEKENDNKSTLATDGIYTQHYTMHCALFHDFIAESITKTEDYVITVNGVSFAGTVGVVNVGSGALICGIVEGLNNGTDVAICKVVLSDKDNVSTAVKLNGISVSSNDDYCPVMINRFADYSALESNYIILEKDVIAGSSLFGKVEKSDGNAATSISILLEGTLKLCETKDKVFTKATLFHSLHYTDGTASYNFNKDKDYSDSTYIHNTTHGQELAQGMSVEYSGLQGKYLDGDPISVNSENVDFTQYLPYVAHSPATHEENYLLENNWHEIAINVKFADLTKGCGTYGHPYLVDASTLTSVASYINNGRASNGWQLKVSTATGKTTHHTEKGDNNNYDVIVTYRNGKFFNGESEYSGNVREYLQTAVYQISEDITLNNFNGIGTKDTSEGSFKGVIYGNNKTITLSGGSFAFIKYSYGSVVRDVNIVLNNSPSLNRAEPPRPNGVTEAKRSPDTFFGGVIGSVLGGDNIIENVTVTTASDFNMYPTGRKSHLIPIGGFVGVINGGGVLFRGNCTSEYSANANNYYSNPFIGRVLGGYAFYEGDGNVPDNGNIKDCQNYKINKITFSQSDLDWDSDNTTLTVNNAQGLLILSAIVSSGAGSTSSVAYTNGVARNATYNKIGKPEEESKADFNLASVDQPGTPSYLLKKFSNCTTRIDVCKINDTNGIAIKFAENTIFDMANYGNGYRGLSARYVSNAAYKTDGVDVSMVVMRVRTFDGQNATVKNIDIDVKEYANDDFHIASMGGIFNIVWTKEQSGGSNGAGSDFAKNLTIQNCNVQLHYISDNGETANQADISSFIDQDGLSCVTVGGFIGSASDVNGNSGKNSTLSNYLFSQIHISGGTVIGPNSAGGLIGATAMTNGTLKGYPGKLLSNANYAHMGPSFLNCSYSNITVRSALASGGLVGDTYAQSESTIPTFTGLGISKTNDASGHYASVTVTDPELTLGANSTIIASAKGGVSGGLFGATGMQNLVNDSKVDAKTGLVVLNSQKTSKIIIDKVTVTACIENVTIYTTSTGINGYGNGGWATAGGLIGRLGSVNYSYFYDTQIKDCCITTGNNTTNEYTGGIVGVGYTNTKLTIQDCAVIGTGQPETNSLIGGKNAGGFLGYGFSAPSFNLNLSDCFIENTTVNGISSSGGVVGYGTSKYYLYNILIKNSSIIGGNASRLIGNTNVNNHDFYLYASGISVYIDPNKDNTIPDRDVNTTDYNGYISYADYAGKNSSVENQKFPYVTVNPNYTLTGTSSESNKVLTGDAVGKIQDDIYNSVAERIWTDNKTGATARMNRAPYVNAGPIVNTIGKTTPEVSTLKAIQGYSDTQWSLQDLPVLVLKGNDVSAIEDYLNVITNGGYGVAKSGGHITVNGSSVSVYYYDEKTKTFSKASNNQLTENPASIYYENEKFHVRSRAFDNTLNRFSLVEVNFNVTVNGEPRTYTVSLPVVVIRELQYDYMATLSYGKEFKNDTYNTIKTHLLDSTGNPFTAYLTYQYNREQGKYIEYDWQSYMDDGGSMLSIDKVLNFSSGLPEGTQMILMDCQNGNQAYQFTTTGGDTKVIQLSAFKSLADGTSFQSSMADAIQVQRSEKTDTGKYVATEENDATVRLNGMYYRPYNSDADEGKNKDRYDLIVPDLSSFIPEENYYLVITVPNQDDSDYYINGYLTSSLNWNMPSSGTKLHRYMSDGKHDVDNSSNTESTYQISTGYSQELSSTTVDETVDLSKDINKMSVKLQDTITFSNQQRYDDSDQLFLKFTTNLKEHQGETAEERQFPVGISGTVKFYVLDPATDTYYKWDTASGNWITASKKTVSTSYLWESNGGNMELLLSADGQNALDLAEVRKLIKGNKDTGESRIEVTAEMDVVFGTSVVLEATIPGSDQTGTDIWAQLHYISQISTQKSSLNYSAMRGVSDDNAKYYRSVTYQAVLSMDAANIDQLGVNPLQLVENYQETVEGKKASRIDLNAVLDLSGLQDIESLLAATEKITFTLSLQRRNGDNYEDVTEESVFVTFDKESTWEISKNQYYQDGLIVTNGIFDGKQFSFPIKAFVFTDQKKYANYKIVVSAVLLDGEGNSLLSEQMVDTNDANVIYTYACIKPTFYTFPS